MSYEVKFTHELQNLKSSTKIFDRMEIWVDEDIGSETPTWDSNYGDALVMYAAEFDEDLGYWVMEDFNDVVGWDDEPSYSIVEKALVMRQQRTCEWLGSVNTMNEPLSLNGFQKSKYFSFEPTTGAVVVLYDDLALKAWLEEHVDTDRFVKWLAENKANLKG